MTHLLMKIGLYLFASLFFLAWLGLGYGLFINSHHYPVDIETGELHEK